MADDNDLFDGEEGLESAMGSDDAFDIGDVAPGMEMGAIPARPPAAPTVQSSPRVQARSPHTSHGGHQRRFGGASQTPHQTTVVVQTAESEPITTNRKRLRTRPMPPKFRNKWPDVATMLITNNDGSQILFIRG